MLNRREFVAGSFALAAAQGSAPARRRLKQSVCRWCYGGLALDDLCAAAARIGYASVELLGEKEWDVPAKHGLTCAMAMGIGTISDGWNRPEHHDRLEKEAARLLPLVEKSKLRNLITFSGNRKGLADDEGARHCITGLKRIAPLAEKHGVTVCLELLNSKVDHPDYQCDRTAWGVGVVKGVGSPRVKLLYDIYHMQIMEGDVIRTIREHIASIGHFHTGGIPGRNEIDDSQELNYRAVCRAIAETGFEGYLAQEFVPTRDPIVSMRRAFEICDV